jgi:hypothetical protein
MDETMPTQSGGPTRGGIPIDAFGGPTVDPTKNVLDLVEAANRRQDDLRQASVARLEAHVRDLETHIKDLMAERDRRYEQRHNDAQHWLEAALAAQKEAVTKAENAAERRFEGVNEFRNTLSDQQRNLIPRSEVEVIKASLTEKINALEKVIDRMEAERMGIKGGWGYAVGLVGLVMTLVALGALVFRGSGL